MRKIKRRKRIKHLPVKRYILLVILMMVIANAGVAITVRLLTFSQTCFTKAQVAADSRCLYIWDNKVFEKGTRSSPHQGHPCGMDVSSLIPSFHMADMAKYLDPNYKGNICSAKSSPTTTPSPIPSSTPTITPTVTYTPTPLPTVTSVPPTPTAVVPPVGGILPTAISSITVTLFPTPTLTVTPAPVCTLPAPVVSIKVVCPLCQ